MAVVPRMYTERLQSRTTSVVVIITLAVRITSTFSAHVLEERSCHFVSALSAAMQTPRAVAPIGVSAWQMMLNLSRW